MLADPRSRQLAENFAGQWLQLRNLADFAPDTQQFPDWNDELRRDMRIETLMFFDSIVREDRSILNLLDGDYTFVNERLARHYGLPDVQGDQFRQVSLVGTPRRGVITQASLLTVTSNPTRTSPVKRGKFILENLLGTPPPPPPPNVPELPTTKEALRGTLRQRMEQHRVNPSCAACHQLMDPLGFALENFDAVGIWRDRDGEAPIDAKGNLPGGESFDGPGELLQVLRESRRDDFVRCFSEKMLVYSLGRGLEYYDVCTVNKIVSAVQEDDFRFSALVMAIVRSRPFQLQGTKTGVMK
jgi:hypothetical protein